MFNFQSGRIVKPEVKRVSFEDEKVKNNKEDKIESVDEDSMLRLDKILQVVTNLYFIIPYLHALRARYIVASYLILIAAITSILHHSTETRYKFPPLYKVSKEYERFFLDVDRLYAVILAFYCFTWSFCKNDTSMDIWLDETN